MRIAIIEDNASVAKGIAYRLQDRGHATDIVTDGQAADEYLRDDANDLIILDIDLPLLDGLSVLRALRARGDARPVLLLTAKADVGARVTGLDAGADDYLTKPFDMDELEARLRALSRRTSPSLRRVLKTGPLTLDLEARAVMADGKSLDLPRRELSLIEALMQAAPRMVPKSALLDGVYGTGADVEESAIEAHISRLRKRLRPYGMDIRVQRGIGYRLAEVDR